MKSWCLIVSCWLCALAAVGQTKARKLHLSITSGLDFSTMSGVDRNGTRVQFPNGTNFRFGALVEFSMLRTWHLVVEPSYNRYTADRPYPLRYRSIEFPIGIRRYMLQGARQLFVNAYYVPDATGTFTLELAPGALFAATGYKSNFAFGGGVSIRRLVVEYRYHTRRNAEDDFGSFHFTYQKQSILVGFRVL